MLLGLIYANGVGIAADDEKAAGISNAVPPFPVPAIQNTGRE